MTKQEQVVHAYSDRREFTPMDVQALLGCEAAPAHSVLGALRKKGWAVRVGTQRSLQNVEIGNYVHTKTKTVAVYQVTDLGYQEVVEKQA